MSVRVLARQPSRGDDPSVGALALKGIPDPVAACEVEWAQLAVRTLQLPLPRAVLDRTALLARGTR